LKGRISEQYFDDEESDSSTSMVVNIQDDIDEKQLRDYVTQLMSNVTIEDRW
jgi:hypothetical protein